MTSLEDPEKPVIPKVFLQAHELMLEAFAYDQQGQLSDAYDLYMQVVRLYVPLFKRFPQTAFLKLFLRGTRLCFSRAKQISAYLSNGKISRSQGAVRRPDHEQQEEALKASMRRTRVVPDLNLTWSDLFGLNQVVKEVKEVVIHPLHYPELLEGRIRVPRSILLFGSPGCGKTELLRVLASVAHHFGVSVFSVTAAQLYSKFVGESQKKVRALFDVSREAAPSIIYIDEFDGMFSSPARQTGTAQRAPSTTASMIGFQMQIELMQYMDGLQTPRKNQTVLIAATNFPWHIQHAQLRRFDRILYVHPPTTSVIRKMLDHLLEGIDHTMKSDDLHRLSLNFKGYTPAEIKKVCERARLCTYDTGSTPRSLEYTDFHESLLTVSPMLLKLKTEEGVGTLLFRDFNKRYGIPRIKYPLEPWEKLDYDPSDDVELKMSGVASEIKYRESLRAEDDEF
jgi:SpoVK/Ycf46/Vps4 family AAA+-type ATPase